MPRKTTIFLASSSELKAERAALETRIGRMNKQWIDDGIFLELVIWEDFIDAMSTTRLQDEYDAAIRAADIFILLVHTKVGKYSAEEFETAHRQFMATKRPRIYTYFKNPVALGDPEPGPDYGTVRALQAQLAGLGHFPTPYTSEHELVDHFTQQLDKLRKNAWIQSPPAAPPAGAAIYSAYAGPGAAVAQGPGAVAVGAGGIHIGGNHSGTLITGTQTHLYTGGGTAVSGDFTLHGGHFIGRDFIQVIEQAVVAGEDAHDAKLALASYLHVLTMDLAGLRLGEIDATTDPTQRAPLELPDVYVPLDLAWSVPEGSSLADTLQRPKRRGGQPEAEPRHDAKARPASAIEALSACTRLTLLGAPGSGKSTLGAQVLLCLAQAWRGHPLALAPLGPAWTQGTPLPLRVVLRRFAEQHAGGTKPPTAGDLWQFIGQDLQDRGWGAAASAMGFVQRLARRHGALVLFDGLDECGDAARRQQVLAAVQAFMQAGGPTMRFLLTARPYAFPDGTDPGQGIFALAEFDDGQVDRFIAGWYAALVKRGWQNEADATRRRDELLQAWKRPDLQPLARNPLLLTLMAMLHSQRGRLPDDRAELYDDTVKLLLERWNRDVGADRALLATLDVPALTMEQLRDVLEKLAFDLHRAHLGHEGVAEVGEDQLVRAFQPRLHNKHKGDLVVEFIERRAGLLVGQGERDGERRFTFPHRTFQEFLAARHLSTRDDFAQTCRRLAEQDFGHWQVVLPLAARLAKAERGATAADELLGGVEVDAAQRKGPQGPGDWQRALMAGLLLQEIGAGQLAALGGRTQAVLDKVRGWLRAGLPLHPAEGGAAAPVRARMGDVLAALGDPRFDSARAYLPAEPHLGFVELPEVRGFHIGVRRADRARVEQACGGKVRDHEINEHPVTVPAFWIARHPVTVAQFRAYLGATGRQPESADALRDPDHRPVRIVSWHEALDYCRWLQQRLREAPGWAAEPLQGLLLRGLVEVTLPSELEWERAAKGGDDRRVFSWGDAQDAEGANSRRSGVLDTSPVGCFRADAAGVHDLLGNVWEWTRSHWAPYPYGPDFADRESLESGHEVERVVRGGAFYNTPDLVRCTYRIRYGPVLRDLYVGFRVVLRSAPVSNPKTPVSFSTGDRHRR